MEDLLYSDALLDAAADIPARKALDEADARARKVSKVCGSDVEVALKVQDGTVADVAIDAKACALGQASASLFGRHVIGATPNEIREGQRLLRAILKEGASAPETGRWASLKMLEPIKDYPARHASTLLVFDAAVACLDQVEGA